MTWKADPLSDPNSGFGPDAPVPCCERDTDGDGTCRTHDTRLKTRELEAIRLALAAHGAQTHGDRPFGCHLLDVMWEVDRWHLERLFPGILCAAALHDSVEDTDLTLEAIEDMFGHEVADWVDGVTDEPGANRAERKTATYVKTRQTQGAVALKLCDRIANVKQCLRDGNGGFLTMYRSEQPGFRSALRREGEFEMLWDELERLLASVPDQRTTKRIDIEDPLVFHQYETGTMHLVYEVVPRTHAVCGVSLGAGDGPSRSTEFTVGVDCADCLGFLDALR